jgi:hypothetical protein
MRLFYLSFFLLPLVNCQQNLSSEGIQNSTVRFDYIYGTINDMPIFHNPDSNLYAWTGDYSSIGHPDTSIIDYKLDSLFNILLDDDFRLVNAWYQHADSHCGNLAYPPPPKLVIRLEERNNLIQAYSFVLLRSQNIFDNCSNLRFRIYTFYN